MALFKRRSVADFAPVPGLLKGRPLAQAVLKTLPPGTMPQLRQAGLRERGVRLTANIRKAAKTHQTGCPAVRPRTLGSTMNALSIALKSSLTLTDLMGLGAAWLGSLKGCHSLLTLCPDHSL